MVALLVEYFGWCRDGVGILQDCTVKGGCGIYRKNYFFWHVSYIYNPLQKSAPNPGRWGRKEVALKDKHMVGSLFYFTGFVICVKNTSDNMNSWIGT